MTGDVVSELVQPRTLRPLLSYRIWEERVFTLRSNGDGDGDVDVDADVVVVDFVGADGGANVSVLIVGRFLLATGAAALRPLHVLVTSRTNGSCEAFARVVVVVVVGAAVAVAAAGRRTDR